MRQDLRETFGAPKTNDDEITAPKPQLVELPARVTTALAHEAHPTDPA